MIVIVPSDGDTLESQASQFFGRCSHFIVAVVENGEITKWDAFPNPALDQAGGAGIAAAQFAAEHKADALVTIALGPKAEDALQRLGIRFIKGKPGTVKENISIVFGEE
jgi:predicted Fe-Mo cluster-binding NifX family protein